MLNCKLTDFTFWTLESRGTGTKKGQAIRGGDTATPIHTRVTTARIKYCQIQNMYIRYSNERERERE